MATYIYGNIRFTCIPRYLIKSRRYQKVRQMIFVFQVIQKESSPVLEPYGSFVIDMFSPQSDLDVSINFVNRTSELPREKKLQILKTFAKNLRSMDGKFQLIHVLLLLLIPIYWNEINITESYILLEQKFLEALKVYAKLPTPIIVFHI